MEANKCIVFPLFFCSAIVKKCPDICVGYFTYLAYLCKTTIIINNLSISLYCVFWIPFYVQRIIKKFECKDLYVHMYYDSILAVFLLSRWSGLNRWPRPSLIPLFRRIRAYKRTRLYLTHTNYGLASLVSRSGELLRHGLVHFWILTVIRDSPICFQNGGQLCDNHGRALPTELQRHSIFYKLPMTCFVPEWVLHTSQSRL